MLDLIIIGANASGISHAIKSSRAGIKNIRLITQRSETVYPELIAPGDIDVSYREKASNIKKLDDGSFEVITDKQKYVTRCVIIAPSNTVTDLEFPPGIVPSDRVLLNDYQNIVEKKDVLIVGNDDYAVEAAKYMINRGANIVLAMQTFSPARLSFATKKMIDILEQQRKLTVLYRSAPEKIELINGYPMAYFNNRQTPDLEFDYVIYSSTKLNNKSYVEVDDAIQDAKEIIFAGSLSDKEIEARLSSIFDGISFEKKDLDKTNNYEEIKEELRSQHYNATITYFEPTHSDLWVLGVKPDNGDVSHAPGQYASLGLGFFEDRIDDAIDPGLDDKWEKLVRRSYSISNKIFDDNDYLASNNDESELEFYIVLVPPSDGKVPGLTPRLALKRPGDRIYLGPKVAGRYTLAPVSNPNNTVVFLSTGTGEAPHNAMIVDLLSRGHSGQIVSVVSVRNLKDLGYMEKHRELEKRFSNYTYIALPTREANIEKRYIQSLLSENILEDEYKIDLDPKNTHVFLCGNPSMIGIPQESDGEALYPESIGAIELLVKRGFVLDERKKPGNIHVEEYW